MITLRQATLQDIALIQSLADASWNSTYSSILSSQQIQYMLGAMYSEVEISSHFENPNYRYYLLFEEDRALGFIGFEHAVELNTTKLHRIYLLSEAQGKGAGRLALDWVKAKTKDYGDTRLILCVNKYNSARAFYQSQGFNIYDEAIFDIGEGYVMDDYLMVFEL